MACAWCAWNKQSTDCRSFRVRRALFSTLKDEFSVRPVCSFRPSRPIRPTVEAIEALGFALEALGDDGGAVARYEQAVALNTARKGSFANAHVSLAAFYNRTDKPDKALEHFVNLKNNVSTPISASRAEYWCGRAAEAKGDKNLAKVYYTQASLYPTTFYGQLGAAALSFAQGIRVEPGDRFEIEADAFALPLRNPMTVATGETVAVKPL